MDHDHIKNKDIVEKYILHQLSEEEETSFEEHLLFCDECQQLLEKRKTAINVVNELATSPPKEHKIKIEKPTKSYNFLFKIAASLAILFAIAWIINILLQESGKGKKIAEFKVDSLINKREAVSNDQLAIDNSQNALREKFKLLPEFENFVKSNVRAENLKVISPAINQKFKRNSKIDFKWEYQGLDSLNLVIFDNKAKVLFEVKISSPFNLQSKLEEGLYYWQLETEAEALFTGKFIIEK